MAKTEVILTHNIVGLGGESDQVKVAAGYARNYLFPQGLAVPLTGANKRRLEVLKQRRAEREAHELNTMTELAKSLSKLVSLPESTRVYCGHEYTEANIRFAKSIEPNNKALAARAEEVAKLRAAGKPTIPATIGAEKAANPFLRADNSELAISLGLGGQPAWKVFAEIRERKNRF